MNRVGQIQITKADAEHRRLIVSLLQSERLPVEDLPVVLDNFFVAIQNGSVIGAIGLEQYGSCGLLRSLVVNNLYRSKGIASGLVRELENQAVASGVDCMYLLTESAPGYFEKKGYEKISRDEVPGSIQAAPEFSSVCPVSAIVMKKTFTPI